MRKESFSDYRIDVDERGADVQRTTCPECRHTADTPTKCLTVWLKESTWACAKCGWGKGLRLRTLYEPSDKRFPPYPTLSKEKIKKPLIQPENAVFDFFAKRGISRATVEKFKVRWDAASGAIAFPFLVSGQVVNVKYRSLAEKRMWQTEGGSRTLFNLDAMQDEVVITEGEIDTMSVDEAGIASVVSVPDGAPPAGAQNITAKFGFLEPLKIVLQHTKKVILATDADPNGRRLAKELAERIGKEKCWLVKFPEGCKDANDVLVKFGADRLRSCIASATPYPPSFAKSVSHFEDEILDLYRNGPPRRLSSGFPNLDKRYLPAPGMITVVTGAPGSGKSVFMANYLTGLAKNENWKVAWSVPENPGARHQRICSQILFNKAFDPNLYGRMEEAELRQGMQFFEDKFFYIFDDNRQLSLPEILMATEYFVKAHSINALVIDPWNKVLHDWGRDNEHTYTGRVLSMLQVFARRTGIHIFIVAHPTKLVKKDDHNNYEVPLLYNVSGSSHWYNMTDNGLTVHRYRKIKGSEPTGESTNSIFVTKVKEDWVGSEFYEKLHFNSVSQKFSEIEQNQFNNQKISAPVQLDEDKPPF